jgi:hypothetical protein
MNRLQFVSTFPYWGGINFFRYEGSPALLYDWVLVIGYWEVRKWRTGA